MRGPKPPPLSLTDTERQELLALTRAHRTPQQLALRAQLVLAAAAGANNAQLARQFSVTVDTARLWRRRWLGLQPIPLTELSVEERLTDIPRAGRPAQITAEAVCRIEALACEAPSLSGRPISHWSAREVAEEIVARGIVAQISPRHAARLLKRGICSRTASATG
jgi:putative transposase